MDDHLLSGYCDERRHRCLELRLRRAEGGHVRRQARRQLLVCTDLTYSEDGNVWYSLSAGVPFTPVLSDNWKWVKFKRTVKARYIRVYVGLVTGWTSMNEAEIYGPAN